MDKKKFDELWNQLTPRQLEVLQEYLAGEIDTKIAESLNVTAATVRKHFQGIVALFFPNKEDRSSKRAHLVNLVANYKPELLSDCTSVASNKPKNEGLIISCKQIPKIVRIIE